jgi:hypothetical protein
MSQQRNQQKTYTEADLQLALSNICSQRVQSQRRAATIYSVPQRTISHRRNGKRPQRNYKPNSKRLTKLEEEVILQGVLEYSIRSLPVSKADVRDMADRLLRERAGKPVGKNWVDNFIKRTPELRTRWSRPYDY